MNDRASSLPKLIITPPKGPTMECVLDKPRNVVGKAATADILLNGWSVAREHAVFIVDAGDVFVEDLGGFFGTYVDNERTVRFGPIQAEHEVVIGSFRFQLASRAGQASGDTPGLPRSPREAPSAIPERHADPVLPASAPPPRHDAPIPVPPVPVAQPSVPRARRNPNDDPVFRWRKELHQILVEEMESRRMDVNRMKDEELRANVRTLVNEIIARTPQIARDVADASELSQMVLDEAVGLGPLENILRDDSISEIMVNGFDDIWIERGGRLYQSETGFTSDKAVLSVIERIVTPLGRRIDESSPLVDARLKDGSRVNAIIPPLALKGPCITIRKFSRKKLNADQLVTWGSLTPAMLEVIRNAVEHRKNIVVSGGTGTGKTTFLNMLSSFIPDDERIITIEDAAELVLEQPNLVSLESRPPNAEGKGQISIRELVRNSLRMRPDRIVIGECRGGEALDMLQAMNTGHDGSLTTLHANTPRDALSRMEVLVTMAGTNLPTLAIRQQIASAVNLIVQLTRFACGARKVTSITEIVGMEGDTVQMQEIFAYRQSGRSPQGHTLGRHTATGSIPDFYAEMKANGIPLNIDIFAPEAVP